MDFKKKAGLALALAAIFTTAGSGAALADNATTSVTGNGANIVTQGTVGGDLQVGTADKPIVPVNGVVTLTGNMTAPQKTALFVTDGKQVDVIKLGVGTPDVLMLVGDGSGKIFAGNTGTTLVLDGGDTFHLGTTAPGWVEQGGILPDLIIGDITQIGTGTTETINVKAGPFVGKTVTTEVTNTTADTFALNVDDNGRVAFDSIDLVTTNHTADTIGLINVDSVGADMVSGWSVSGDVNLGIGANKIEFLNAFGANEATATHLLAGGQFKGKFAMGENQKVTLGTTDMTFVERALADLADGNEANEYKPYGTFGFNNAANTGLEYYGILGVYAGQTLAKGSSYNVEVADDSAPAAALAEGNIAFSDSSVFAVDAQMGREDVDDDSSDVVFTYDIANPTIGLGTGNGVFTIGGSANTIVANAGDAAPASNAAAATFYAQNAAAGRTLTVAQNISDSKLFVKIGDKSDTGAAENIISGNAALVWTDSAAANAALDIALANTGNWNVDDNTLVFSSDLLTGEFDIVYGAGADDNALVLTVIRDTTVEVQDVYPYLSNGMAGTVDDLYGDNAANKGENNVNSDNAGIRFVSRATDNYFMPDHEWAAATLEGAAQIAVAAGVPFITNNVVTRISDLIVDHNNLLNDTQPAYGNEPGSFGIWANPFYATGDTDGMDAGRFQNGFDYNYGGAAFGIDYNINEAFRLGLALNVGGGDSDSEDGNSDFNTTNADFDFFGVSLYGSYTNGAFGLTGDLGFTGVDYEIDQNLPGSMGMGNLESDVDSNAFTLGLTGQYRFAASDNFNITPHLGLRFTQISVDDSDVNLRGGGRVFDVTTEDQNLFQIPLGVEFSSNIVTDGGWTITPSADLGVLFTAGDTDVETRAHIAGTNFSTGAMNADVNDSAAFQGRLGIKAAADNGLSLGLDYGILAGGNQTDHQFSGMLRFEF